MTEATPEQIVAFFMRGHMADPVERLEERLRVVLKHVEELRAEVEWLTKVLTDIHDDGRCPSWLCQHIEIILANKP